MSVKRIDDYNYILNKTDQLIGIVIETKNNYQIILKSPSPSTRKIHEQVGGCPIHTK
jgi:hypothetical protein